jgi:rare lipoprotein A
MLMKRTLFFIIAIFTFYQSHAQIKKGTASYYAAKFEGRRCASGERFSNDSLTCAHNSLPFGTLIKVCSAGNNCVVVKVNDRLSKRSKRTIDLSQHAAKQIGLQHAGFMKVTYEVVGKDSIIASKRTYHPKAIKNKKRRKKGSTSKKKKLVRKKKSLANKKVVSKKKVVTKKKVVPKKK